MTWPRRPRIPTRKYRNEFQASLQLRRSSSPNRAICRRVTGVPKQRFYRLILTTVYTLFVACASNRSFVCRHRVSVWTSSLLLKSDTWNTRVCPEVGKKKPHSLKKNLLTVIVNSHVRSLWLEKYIYFRVQRPHIWRPPFRHTYKIQLKFILYSLQNLRMSITILKFILTARIAFWKSNNICQKKLSGFLISR